VAEGSLTWLGHAAFRLDSPGGKRIYVDPFLDNPKCPASERAPERVDIIAITHGHSDHVGSTVELTEKFGPIPVVAMVELKGWLEQQGAQMDNLPGLNKGGTVEHDGIKFTLTNAFHSSSANDLTYLGEPAGIVVELEDGVKVYFAGDTCVFGDMQLIRRIHSPDVAVLPIGGHFTMDPREAAVAIELLGVKRVVPCHYGTFPILRGTPGELKQLATGARIEAVEPGGSISL
jgi:L-ascorbate metabolism protein UlaG (beta-lactamase superfamily)